jgi:hypothetical protein
MDVRFEQRVTIKFKRNVNVLPHLPYSPYLSPCDFFLFPRLKKKKAKRTATWEYRSYSSGCDDGAHRHFERGIHQLLSGLAETLATVYWRRRELLRRGQEALVVRLNFVFFTDPVSELYGQRITFMIIPRRILLRVRNVSKKKSYRENQNIFCVQ